MITGLPALYNCPFCNGKAQYRYSDIPMICCDRCQAQIRGEKIYLLIPDSLYGHLVYLSGLWNRREGV